MNGNSATLESFLAKLAGVRAVLDRPSGETEDSGKKLLHQRAVKLAQTEPPAISSETMLQLLQFRLATEHYGIEAHCVEKVMHAGACVHLPGGPHHLLGVMNDNGETLALFDSHPLFSVAEAETTEGQL